MECCVRLDCVQEPIHVALPPRVQEVPQKCEKIARDTFADDMHFVHGSTREDAEMRNTRKGCYECVDPIILHPLGQFLHGFVTLLDKN